MTGFLVILRKILKRPLSLFGTFLVCAMVLISLTPKFFSNYDPFEIRAEQRLLPPSKTHFVEQMKWVEIFLVVLCME